MIPSHLLTPSVLRILALYSDSTRVNTAPLPLDDKSKRDRERVAQEGSEGGEQLSCVQSILGLVKGMLAA